MSGHEVASCNETKYNGTMDRKRISCDLKCNDNNTTSTFRPSTKEIVSESDTRYLAHTTSMDVTRNMIISNSFNNSTSPYPLADSNIQAPAVTSVWLEQGEYFFDDEFAVPLDDQLNNSTEINKFSLMTQSMNNGHILRHKHSLPDQSYSDSCLFSPVGSAESTSSDANNVRLTATGYSTIQKSYISRSLAANNGFQSEMPSSKLVSHGVPENGLGNNGSLHMYTSDEGPCEGNIEQSVNSSRASCSTSWIQMVMDRSCNPELRALINRTAAAVDYRLAYGDSVAMQQQFEDQSLEPVKQSSLPLGANNLSSSQGNLLNANSLAGLRYALDQTTQLLPNRMVAENSTVCSVGVSADFISGKTLSPTKSGCSVQSHDFNVTTWAKKHGSRESLRRKSSKNVLFMSPDAKDESIHNAEPTNVWRAIKEANSNLVTWNQLKRIVRRAESVEKTSSVHESRRNQYANSIDLSNSHMMDRIPGSRTSNRSHSQPMTNACHMHRFSGTLLEIFMRAKMRDMGSSTVNGDNPAIQLNDSPRKDVGDSIYSNLNAHVNRRVIEPTKPATFDTSYTPSIKKSITLNPALRRSEENKHPLLRGDRILPQKHTPKFPSLTSAAVMDRGMRNFGVQFPAPGELIDSTGNACVTHPYNDKLTPTPILSNKLPSHNLGKNGSLNYYTAVRRSHPQPLYLSRPLSALTQQFRVQAGRSKLSGDQAVSSSIGVRQIAACLTASAGPDSPYMSALRAGCAARGFAVGWLGNPRTSIAYPGLGLLSVPRPSRLAGSAFLSHTLPDLSFLSQAGAEEERKGTPTMSKRQTPCTSSARLHRTCQCKRCGCRSASAGHYVYKNACAHPLKCASDQVRHVVNYEKVMDSNNVNKCKCPFNMLERSISNAGKIENFLKNQPRINLHRALSEPELFGTEFDEHLKKMYGSTDMLHCGSRSHKYLSKRSTDKSSNECGDIPNKPKKSVSFSGNIRLLHRHSDSSAQPSPEPKVIPRNWGLYGQEQPLAEFNPRSSPNVDRRSNHLRYAASSDIDVRYQAMINDVINAVQETVSFYCNSGVRMKNDIQPDETSHEAIERQPLLTIVVPLTTLLCDGLLPPAKPIFTSRPRTRLWQLVEESCRPGALPAGVAYHVLNDAVNQVKALTNVTLEKTKFKAFICACLNAKALPMWLNALVVNDNLLRRFYCENAFIRQCRTVQRELYADLMTHLEQLLTFPFDLDISMEARRSMNDFQPASSLKNVPNPSIGSPTQAKKQIKAQEHPNYPVKHLVQTKVPPATVITRRQLIATNSNNLNSRIPSATTIIPTSSATNQNMGINHYHPNHLPSQRSSKFPVNSRLSKYHPSRHPNDDVDNDSAGSSTFSNEDPRILNKNISTNIRVSPTNSQVRGKLKIALSSFRRGGSQPTKPANRATINVPNNLFVHNTKDHTAANNCTSSIDHKPNLRAPTNDAQIKIKTRPEPPKSITSCANKSKYPSPKLKSSPSK